jgi:hypothetical protein
VIERRPRVTGFMRKNMDPDARKMLDKITKP